MSSFDDRSVHRLAGSTGNEVGGLLIQKKSQAADKKGEEGNKKISKWDQKSGNFKKPGPRASLLGLDVLAKRKREERELKGEATFTEKKQRLCPGQSHDDQPNARTSFGKFSSERQRERLYRQPGAETPSHPGGVSEEALQRIQSRLRRDKFSAVGARSRDREADTTFRSLEIRLSSLDSLDS